MKLALIHDALVNFGGAERLVSVFHEFFPDAPIYTTVYLPDQTHASLAGAEIRQTFPKWLVRSEAGLKRLFPLTYLVMGSLDLAGCDVILSSSTFCAKNVCVPAGAIHICYCYSFFRPAWEFDAYVARFGWNQATRAALRPVFAGFRRWDYRSAQKPHWLVAISRHVAKKLEHTYRRKAAVICPPVDVARYPLAAESEDFFLVVSRLMPYKRIDIVVEAFRRLQYPLKILGVGPDAERLRNLAGPRVEFVGAVSEETLVDYYRRCRALVFPGEEDFGLVPLEAHACGKPVVALGRGGALETILAINDPSCDVPRNEVTGVFFYEQTAEAVIEAVRQFERASFSSDAIRRRAWAFDKAIFRRKIFDLLDRVCSGLPPAGLEESPSQLLADSVGESASRSVAAARRSYS